VKVTTQLKAAVVMVAAGLLLWQSGIPGGWFTDDDDGSREITMIVTSSNDRLLITSATVHSSIHGELLNVVDINVNDNFWDYTFTVAPTEHFRAAIHADVGVETIGDGSSLKCRIEDNGHVVKRDSRVVQPHRTSAQVSCAYVS